MKLMTGGWVWDLPPETEFVEIVCHGDHTRDGVVLYNATGDRIETPGANTVPDPKPWTKRLTA